MQSMIIDTDTASDDAVALIMALRHPEVEVEAITVSAGNVPLYQGVQNALYVAEICGKQVPVHAGVPEPLVQPLITAQEVHGQDGMGDIGLPLSGRTPAAGHAVDLLIEKFLARPGEMDLVALGPLTNIALALSRVPELSKAIRHCYIMGGTGQGTGNVTPLAEYNFWADPEAADIVVRAPMAKTLIGWDISVNSAAFNQQQAAELREIGTRFAHLTVDIQGVLDDYAKSHTKLPGFDLPDPIAMAVALDPEIAEGSDVNVAVIGGSGPSRGAQETDWRGLAHTKPNARVITHVPREKFVTSLRAALT